MSTKCIPDNLHKSKIANLKKCAEKKNLKVIPTGKRGPVKKDYIKVLKEAKKKEIKQKSKEVKSKEAKSKEVKSKEVKSKEVKSKEAKLKEVKSKEVKSKEKKPKVQKPKVQKSPKLVAVKKVKTSPKTVPNPNLLLINAIERGNLPDVKKALNDGASNIKRAFELAIEHDHMELIRFFEAKIGMASCNDGYVIAAKTDNVEALNYFFYCTVDDVYQRKALYEAVKGNNDDAFNYIYKHMSNANKSKINKPRFKKVALGKPMFQKTLGITPAKIIKPGFK